MNKSNTKAIVDTPYFMLFFFKSRRYSLITSRTFWLVVLKTVISHWLIVILDAEETLYLMLTWLASKHVTSSLYCSFIANTHAPCKVQTHCIQMFSEFQLTSTINMQYCRHFVSSTCVTSSVSVNCGKAPVVIPQMGLKTLGLLFKLSTLGTLTLRCKSYCDGPSVVKDLWKDFIFSH